MKSKKFTTIMIVVELIVSLIMVVLVFNLNVLPFQYFALLSAVLATGTFGLWLINRRIKEGKKSRVALDLIIFIVNVALITGNYYFYRSYRALEALTTGSNTQTHTLNIRVLAESEIEMVADIDSKVVEYSSQMSTEYNGQYIEQLQKDITCEFKEVSTYQQLVDDLYDRTCDAIILEEAYEGFLEVFHGNYQNETRVIDTYEFQEVIEEEPEVIEEEPEPVVEEPAVVETPEVVETPAAPVQQKAQNDGNSFSVFISGIDTYGSINTVSRSDVNMVMTVNTSTHQILLTGIPRDYFVRLHSYGVKDKFTHAGIYGVKESMRTAEDFLNIDIDYYVRVNFTSLINIVDALGGISVYNGIGFTNRGYTFPVGQVNMNGAMALVYARERYAYSDGDNQRIKNQQTIMTGMINKAMSPAILAGYDGLLNVIMKSCQTSIPSGTITSLIKNQIDNNASWSIKHQYLTGSGSYSTHTYSMPGYNLYVMIPSSSSVKSATGNINTVVEGGIPNL